MLSRRPIAAAPRRCGRLLALLVGAGLLAACAGEAQVAAPSPAPVESAFAQGNPTAAPPTALAARPGTTSAPPTATAAPLTAAPPTATAAPPAAAPPTATPDPYAEYAAYTIDGLRARTYGDGGPLTVLRVLSETPAFTRELFEYRSDGLRITGQLTRPRGAGPWPVIILNHGYFPLDVYRTGYDTQHASDYLAARGYLTLAPDFRSHAGSDRAPNIFKAGHVIDTLNLLPLAQALPEAQPGKVGMWGHSNGGEITLKAMLVSDQIAAGLIYAPASSFLADSYAAYSSDQVVWDPSNTADYPLTPEQAPELYARLSVFPHLAYIQAPVQWHHGTADPVPPAWSETPHNRLLELGKPSERLLYPGGGHSLTGADKALYLERMVAFFDLHLK